ncbi:MAG: hypothetical protein ABEN55_12945, partial [Bradymonadaceae bacterium]
LEELEAEYDGSPVLKGFSEDEGLALVDLAHLVVLADREVTEAELDQLQTTIFGLTLAEGRSIDELLASGDVASPNEIREVVDEADTQSAFIDERVERIEGDEHRREALRVLSTLAYSDGVVDEEEGICHVIGRLFGFEADTTEELLVEGAVDVWELGGDRSE